MRRMGSSVGANTVCEENGIVSLGADSQSVRRMGSSVGADSVCEENGIVSRG